MYKLYSIAGTCSTAITVLMEQLNLEFEVIQRSSVANYSDIVATNQVPALVCEDQIITEGSAIVLYLLEKHTNYLSSLSISDRTKFYQMLMFNYATLHPAYSKILTILKVTDKPDSELLQKLADKVSDTWKIVDTHLSNQDYMFGSSPTIIDYLITIYSTWGRYFPELKLILVRILKD
jgi:glutathione S-transferase